MGKPKVKIVVEMEGGTIRGVYVDSDAVEVTDVVFLEDEEAGCGAYGEEFKVGGGPMEGRIVYTHHEALLADKFLFDPVMEAAKARLDSAF